MKKIFSKIKISPLALILVVIFVISLFGFQVSKINAQSSLGDVLWVRGGATINGDLIVNWRVGVGYLPNYELDIVSGGAKFSDIVFADSPGKSQTQAVGTVSYITAELRQLKQSVMPGEDW